MSDREWNQELRGGKGTGGSAHTAAPGEGNYQKSVSCILAILYAPNLTHHCFFSLTCVNPWLGWLDKNIKKNTDSMHFDLSEYHIKL